MPCYVNVCYIMLVTQNNACLSDFCLCVCYVIIMPKWNNNKMLIDHGNLLPSLS